MMGSYCEGMFCSKRDQCALHRVGLGTYNKNKNLRNFLKVFIFIQKIK